LDLLDGKKLMHEDEAECMRWLHAITSGRLMICEWKRNGQGQYVIDGIMSPKESDRPEALRNVAARSIGVVTSLAN
jgi:hypothetical protein